MRSKTIKVKYLARVEGEANLNVKIVDQKVKHVELRIFEPPRFFEALLTGRRFHEAPDITARICGICPVAYQLTSVQAIEQAYHILVPEALRDLRKLLYCGEWISSHALHIHLLHAPDFLGFSDSVAMAKQHRAAVERGLQLKKLGNQLMTLINGREVHGINICVGGFYQVPAREQVRAMIEPLKRACDLAADAALWVAQFPFPDSPCQHELVALRHAFEYPMLAGEVASNTGMRVSAKEFGERIVETQVPYSTALHATINGRSRYLTGPLARLWHNADQLAKPAQDILGRTGISPQYPNPFKSIIVRCVEVLHACCEALRLAENYEEPAVSSVKFERPLTAVEGFACTEAPRGILYHHYKIDPDGLIVRSDIIPPTSQNQAAIEDDVRKIVESHLDCGEEILRDLCEKTIRNHDPCISCATHFLDLRIDHGEKDA